MTARLGVMVRMGVMMRMEVEMVDGEVTGFDNDKARMRCEAVNRRVENSALGRWGVVIYRQLLEF